MILNKFYLILFFLISSISCNKSTYLLNYFDDSETQIMSEGLLINGLESGPWIYYAKSGEKIEYGEYYKGLLTGKWIFNNMDTAFEIYWLLKDTTSRELNIQFNYPSNWLNSANSNCLIYLRNSIDSLEDEPIYLFADSLNKFNSIEDYLTLTKNFISSDYELISYSTLLLSTDEFSYFYTTYKIKDGEIDYIVYSSVMEYENYILDLILYTTESNNEYNYIVYRNILTHLYINKDRLYNSDSGNFKIVEISK